ncbi:MAG: hypothetical protein JW860_06810 [Sedimentisphaerales bacterium]|nr:hypothetical protein [Sedimentisphaerales bacterium]
MKKKKHFFSSMDSKHFVSHSSKAFSSVMAMIFVTLFSVLAISFTALTNINVQMSKNHRDMNCAQAAAESGLQFARLLIDNYVPSGSTYTSSNAISESDALETFADFAAYVQDDWASAPLMNGNGVSWNEGTGELRIPATGGITLTSGSIATFSLLFTFTPGDEDNPHQMTVTSTGGDGQVNRGVQLSFPIQKDTRILEFAVASRSRIIVTGDSTIEGDIYSSWNKPAVAPPFELAAESTVNGTVNTVLSEEDFDDAGYDLEDKVLGEHEGINYDQVIPDMPGMDADDYDTSGYRSLVSDMPASAVRQWECFPHQPGNYSAPSGSSRWVNRYVYENQTFTDQRIPANRNALFKNCTFEGVLFIEGTTSSYNNVRFDNCNFNGTMITDVPGDFKWQHNVLYFTGSAIFNNTAMEESTILAPNFNVNLGNTQELIEGAESVLTGAIVGGIVDVRGNAVVDGTILSMYDPSPLGPYAGAYATNVGFSDENNEAGIPEDIGSITITPDPTRMLPSGILTPIVFGNADSDSYIEL